MKYLTILCLFILTACGSAPESGSSGTNGSAGVSGSNGKDGANGANGTNGLGLSKTVTCQSTNVTYRVGTQIDLFYQETTFSDGTKHVGCDLKYNQQYGEHDQYLTSADTNYSTSRCDVRLDIDDSGLGTGYWKFTNDKRLIYNDGSSTVAGLNYDISSFCTERTF